MAQGTSEGFAKQLTVDKVAQPSQPDAYRGGNDDKVGNLPEIHPLPFYNDVTSNKGAKEASVERHAPVPQDEHLQRVFDVKAQVVKDHVPEARTDEKTENKVKIEVIDFSSRDAYALLRDLVDYQEVGRSKSGNVHEPVPADGQRTDLDKDRVYIGIGNHKNSRQFPVASGQWPVKPILTLGC